MASRIFLSGFSNQLRAEIYPIATVWFLPLSKPELRGSLKRATPCLATNLEARIFYILAPFLKIFTFGPLGG